MRQLIQATLLSNFLEFAINYSSPRRPKGCKMSSFFNSYSYYEDTPTLEEVKDEISNIVGLSEIKLQLSDIVKNIYDAEKRTTLGYRVIPPKPFHTVFIGNSGTGKSMVARILGKLFRLAGALPGHNIVEMEGRRERIEKAKGGILLVNVDEIHEHKSDVLEEIISAMDSEETAVIFGGQRKLLNQCIMLNKELYKRFSAVVNFGDSSCEELALILTTMMNDDRKEEYDMYGFKLHSSCSIDTITKIIQKGAAEKLRSELNGYLSFAMT